MLIKKLINLVILSKQLVFNEKLPLSLQPEYNY